ncbi:unnamed protein product [Closterium sp. Naga37s-1]|nr:unnamed protein product [Closterium sp. Naga37s-1]
MEGAVEKLGSCQGGGFVCESGVKGGEGGVKAGEGGEEGREGGLKGGEGGVEGSEAGEEGSAAGAGGGQKGCPPFNFLSNAHYSLPSPLHPSFHQLLLLPHQLLLHRLRAPSPSSLS